MRHHVEVHLACLRVVAADGVVAVHGSRAVLRPVQVPVVLLGQHRLGFAGGGEEQLHVIVESAGVEGGQVPPVLVEGTELRPADGDPAHLRGDLGDPPDLEFPQHDWIPDPLEGTHAPPRSRPAS